jgi:hypothetical protein
MPGATARSFAIARIRHATRCGGTTGPTQASEYRVFARDYDPTVADVSTARAHALRVGCEHCGGYAVGRADGPYFTGCGCAVPIHGRILEPVR